MESAGGRISDATLLEELLTSRKEMSALNEVLTHARGQKDRMAAALQEAREQVVALKEEVD